MYSKLSSKVPFIASGLDPRFLVDTLRVNIDNENMSDESFREFVRNTLPLYMGTKEVSNDDEPSG